VEIVLYFGGHFNHFFTIKFHTMKKSYALRIASLAVAALFLASCGSMTNFSVQKRQHRPGYYVDWGNGKVKTEKTEAAARMATTQVQAVSPSPSTKAAKSPVSRPAPVPATTAATASAPATPAAAAKRHNTIEVVATPEAAKASSSSSSFRMNDSALSDALRHSSGDTPDWVIAVLCILLPPLAVFLRLGIGSEFWISLLLTLLFWIPGVIYAFIVCF
jgi:uncharacterized membrane protein YqaE (UPF0057 family)